MSIARGFGLNGKSTYTNIVKPCEVWCNFIVDSANGNGYGVRSVKSNGYIESVFMHTSATPGVIGGYTNPNPISGYIQFRFRNNFNYYLGGFTGQVNAPASSGVTSLTAGHVYYIDTLGSTTTAQWQTAGVPPGFIPTVGLPFVSLITGSISGSGTVYTAGVPLTTTFTAVGDSNQTIANTAISQNAGANVLVACYAPSGSSGASVLTAPADNTVLSFNFMFDGSSVTIDGI